MASAMFASLCIYGGLKGACLRLRTSGRPRSYSPFKCGLSSQVFLIPLPPSPFVLPAWPSAQPRPHTGAPALPIGARPASESRQEGHRAELPNREGNRAETVPMAGSAAPGARAKSALKQRSYICQYEPYSTTKRPSMFAIPPSGVAVHSCGLGLRGPL